MVERLERVPALVAREDPAPVVRPVRAAHVDAPDGEIRALAAAEDSAEARAVAGGALGGGVIFAVNFFGAGGGGGTFEINSALVRSGLKFDETPTGQTLSVAPLSTIMSSSPFAFAHTP